MFLFLKLITSSLLIPTILVHLDVYAIHYNNSVYFKSRWLAFKKLITSVNEEYALYFAYCNTRTTLDYSLFRAVKIIIIIKRKITIIINFC